MIPALPTAALGSALATIGDGLRAISCELCERCLDRDRVSVATEHWTVPVCGDCYDDAHWREHSWDRKVREEHAWDRRSDAEFYGGSGPVTLAEQMTEGRRNK